MDGLGLNKDQISFVIMFFAVGEIGGKILIAVVGTPLLYWYIIYTIRFVILGNCCIGSYDCCQDFSTNDDIIYT